ncbi:Hypothetical_protein [Hexamita inflata]|uniref:Hypothetical_protein n=1 Tax=Hexamita inflata TaxID=28002 RepID=A0AA86R152_9EUKA|nr:Hypothetical protein HINF_LOCUS23565 [Hexamita inflata]CAI9968355.1 Hypothetical protein HINF_LOCUS56000 [Hexamita inflata]
MEKISLIAKTSFTEYRVSVCKYCTCGEVVEFLQRQFQIRFPSFEKIEYCILNGKLLKSCMNMKISQVCKESDVIHCISTIQNTLVFDQNQQKGNKVFHSQLNSKSYYDVELEQTNKLVESLVNIMFK